MSDKQPDPNVKVNGYDEHHQRIRDKAERMENGLIAKADRAIEQRRDRQAAREERRAARKADSAA